MCREFLFCWLIQWRYVFWIRNLKMQLKDYFLQRIFWFCRFFLTFDKLSEFCENYQRNRRSWCHQIIVIWSSVNKKLKKLNVYFLIRTYLCCSANNFFFLALAICLALPFLLSKCVFIEKLRLRWFAGRDELTREAKSKPEKESKLFIPFHRESSKNN